METTYYTRWVVTITGWKMESPFWLEGIRMPMRAEVAFGRNGTFIDLPSFGSMHPDWFTYKKK